MATRARRPVTVKVQAPRPSVRIMRSTVYGPTSTTTTTIDPATGQITTATVRDTDTAQKRNLVKGSLVYMNNSRSTGGMIPSSMYLLRWPDATLIGERQHVTIGHVSNRVLYVVEAVSDDGKFLAARPAIQTASRYGMRNDGWLTERLVVVERSTEPPRMPADLVGPLPRRPSLDTLANSIARTAWCSQPTPVTFHRTSHVVQVVDPDHIDPDAWLAIRAHLRKNVADELHRKLRDMVAHKQWRKWSYFESGMSPYRIHDHMGSQNAMANLGASVAREIATYRYALNNWLASNDKLSEELLVGLSRMCSSAASRVSRYRRESAQPAMILGAVKRGLKRPIDVSFGQCGHLHSDGEGVELAISVSDGVPHYAEFCPQCAKSSAATAMLRDGERVRVHLSYIRTYEWSDGTTRIWSEPEIIGQRHSGKGVVGFVPSVNNVQRAAMVTCGIEIEVQSVDPSKRNAMAQQLLRRVKDANVLTESQVSKYWHMEHDGSTGDGGFEIVTGYTDHATHDKVLGAVFANADGSNAWVGKLLGHDARGQACGIHVHVQKPTSLIHATKIRQFVNASANERLIRAVARRYGNSYCTYSSQAAQDGAAQAVKVYKDHKRTYTSPKETVRTALMRLNANSRYEAVNFQNSATVEFRMFRSSTKYTTIMACIEFSLAVWRFARATKAESMTTEAFLRFIEQPEQRAETRHLRNQLKSRGFDVAVPNPRKVTEQVAETV